MLYFLFLLCVFYRLTYVKIKTTDTKDDTIFYTNVDKLNEILASENDFSLVHRVDGHLQSFVHGQRRIA